MGTETRAREEVAAAWGLGSSLAVCLPQQRTPNLHRPQKPAPPGRTTPTTKKLTVPPTRWGLQRVIRIPPPRRGPRECWPTWL